MDTRERLVQLVIACVLCLLIGPVLDAEPRDASTTSPIGSLTAKQLDALAEQKAYPELQGDVAAATLTKRERTYFQGIIADRTRQISECHYSPGKILGD
jgi:hypothetical protein